jgi:GH18 family chitinase
LKDIDWEYPNHNGDRPQDKGFFNDLLQDIKNAIGSGFMLSAAIGAGAWRTDLSYDIPRIFQICDFVNLMTYDVR